MGIFTLSKPAFTPSTPTPPPPIVNIDILPLILHHLGTRDLLSCLRASRAVFEVASRILYATTELEYGREWERTTFNVLGRPNSIPRNIFQGIDKPALPRLRRESFWPFNGRQPHYSPTPTPFIPSPMKVALLRHVRSLTYYSHPRDVCDQISLPLFPALETLTIIAHRLPSRPPTADEDKWGVPEEDHRVDWTSPLLNTLRPRHLRLIHIPSVNLQRYTSYPLPSVFGESIEKVTLHFLSCLTDRYGLASERYYVGSPPEIAYPLSMKELDVVFMLEDDPSRAEVGAYRPVFYHKEAPPLYEADVGDAARAVAAILAEAVGDGKREIKIRLVGLETYVLAPEDLDSDSTLGVIETRRSDDSFAARLRSEYKSGLVKNGLGAGEAERWAGDLDIVQMAEYVLGGAATGELPRIAGVEGLESRR